MVVRSSPGQLVHYKQSLKIVTGCVVPTMRGLMII